jgi:transcriptional regulator with XRE-family HTH domain
LGGALVKVEARQPDAASEMRRLQRAISSVLKASLDDADVRPKDLADKLGWTRRQVYNLLQGRKAVRVLDLILIARVLRINAELLFRRIVRWE